MLRWIGLYSVVIFLIFALGFLRWQYFDVDIKRIIVESVFILSILAVGTLRVYLPKLDNIIVKGVGYYIVFTICVVLFIVPGSLYLVFGKLLIAQSILAWWIVYFIISVALWVLCLTLLTRPRWRTWLFDLLSSLAWFAPAIFLYNFLMISVILFAFGSYFIFEELKLASPPIADISIDDYLNVFLWHVLDAIPGLDINKTIAWKEPLERGTPSLFGVLILLFKLSVIIPGIGAFVTYWKTVKGTKVA